MSKKVKEKTIKEVLIEPWDTLVVNPEPQNKKAVLGIAAALIVIGIAYYKWLHMDIAFTCLCVYVGLWMIYIIFHTGVVTKDDVLSKAKSFKHLKEIKRIDSSKTPKHKTIVSMVFAVLFSIPAVIVVYCADLIEAILGVLKILCLAKHILVILISLGSSLGVIYFVASLMDKSNELFPGAVNEKNAENILVFATLVILYVLTRFVLWIAITYFDPEYKKCSGELSKKNYKDTIYTEAKLIFTMVLIICNVIFKVFVVGSDYEKFINAFFIASTIITMFNTCALTWKNIDESKYIKK